MSLLQAETLAASLINDWPIVFAENDGAPAALRRAVTELGLNLQILDL